MQFRQTLQLLVAAGIVSASPAQNRPRTLNFDDVILLNSDGSTSIIKENEYAGLIARGVLSTEAPSTHAVRDTIPPKMRVKARRGCEESTEIEVLSNTTFIGSDVGLSPVVSAAGGSATVSIEAGYEIGNELSVGSSLTAGNEDILALSLSVDFTQSWTSSASTSMEYTVPDGQYGIVVSQPMTTRVTGTLLSGCTDSPTSTNFTSDSYTSQDIAGMAWVTGVVRLCNSTTYPIPYCVGSGTHA